MPWKRLVHWANLAAATILIAWILGASFGGPLFGDTPWPGRIVDYHVNFDMSREVVGNGTYPPLFAYPPPGVLFHYAFGLIGFEPSAFLWLCLMAAATIGCFVCLLDALELRAHPARWVLALVAFALTGYFIQWDLKSQNCNMMYLFLLAAGLAAIRRSHGSVAGLCFASSMSLKLYSFLVAPYLLARGRYRLLGVTLVWLVMLAVILPILGVGFERAALIYQAWFARMWGLVVQGKHYDFWNLVSLRKCASVFWGIESPSATLFVLAARGLWLAMLALYFWPRSRAGEEGGSHTSTTLDLGIVAIAPVVISPFLEVFHLVPVLIVVLALLKIATETKAKNIRWAIGASLFLAWLTLKFGPKGELRGFGVYAYCQLLLVAAVASRLLPLGKVARTMVTPCPGEIRPAQAA